MSTALVVSSGVLTPDLALQLAHLACSQLSANTQRAYTRAITSYLSRGRPLCREAISAYIAGLRENGNGPVTCNIALAALKLLSREAELRGLLDPQTLHAIERVKSQPVRGQKLGNWTDADGIEALIAACTDSRERALIAIMCGCGLRRSEVAGLDWMQYQERAGRMVLLDIVGKGGRVRTVAVPTWVSDLIDEYKTEETICAVVRSQT